MSSLIKIYQAFYNEINSITPSIDIVHQSLPYTPTDDVPYVELYILPASDETIFMGNDGYETIGVMQLNLRYPTNKGLGDILTRVELYKAHFKSKPSITYDGLKISLLSNMKVVNLGQDGDRLLYSIRINFKALVDI